MTVKTRFAPSPTGNLHIGGARTALFAWLYARKNKGQFVLRIEDTDLERSKPEFVDAIMQGMKWLQLDHDEGPFYQTKRLDRYQEVIQTLLDQGDAYRCDCSKERLEKLRADQMAQKLKPKYDGCCRNRDDVNADKAHVIRFKNPLDGAVEFNDLIKGSIKIQNAEIDDLIISRSDGSPTYNLTVVVDDFDMEITHVIRGDDHINNTPRQINILNALAAPLPIYAHVPMILGLDGKRLSKRQGAMSVTDFEEKGYLPEAVINYLLRLGWSHGDQELFSTDEMVNLFELDNVSRSAATYDPTKLSWFNQHYIKNASFAKLEPALRQQFSNLGVDLDSGPDLESVFDIQRERVKTLAEFATASALFYTELVEFDAKAARKNLKAKAVIPLKKMLQKLGDIDWQKSAIHDSIKAVVDELEVGFGQVALPLRVAVTGSTVSPAIDETVWLMGRQRVLQRIEHAIELIENEKIS